LTLSPLCSRASRENTCIKGICTIPCKFHRHYAFNKTPKSISPPERDCDISQHSAFRVLPIHHARCRKVSAFCSFLNPMNAMFDCFYNVQIVNPSLVNKFIYSGIQRLLAFKNSFLETVESSMKVSSNWHQYSLNPQLPFSLKAQPSWPAAFKLLHLSNYKS